MGRSLGETELSCLCLPAPWSGLGLGAHLLGARGGSHTTGQERDKQRDDCVRGPEWSPRMEEVKCASIISIAVFSPRRIKNAVSGILFAPISFFVFVFFFF